MSDWGPGARRRREVRAGVDRTLRSRSTLKPGWQSRQERARRAWRAVSQASRGLESQEKTLGLSRGTMDRWAGPGRPDQRRSPSGRGQARRASGLWLMDLGSAVPGQPRGHVGPGGRGLHLRFQLSLPWGWGAGAGRGWEWCSGEGEVGGEGAWPASLTPLLHLYPLPNPGPQMC